jgi:MtN3 and saliva related transmembrane protein
MYVVTVIGFVLWIGYGAAIGRWPIVASNAICLLMSSAVLVLKFKFGSAREAG